QIRVSVRFFFVAGESGLLCSVRKSNWHLLELTASISVSIFVILCCMKATPGTLREGGASFATTHWSIVARSALTDVPEAANALAELCDTYWPPIYSFIRRRGYSPADAKDLTQGSFAHSLQNQAYAQ